VRYAEKGKKNRFASASSFFRKARGMTRAGGRLYIEYNGKAARKLIGTAQISYEQQAGRGA